MNTMIMLLTKEIYKLFKPYIMPDIWQHIEGEGVFGYGIVEENLAVGAIVCAYNDGMVNILSLGISPDYCRKGLASKLVRHLEQECASQKFDEINARYFLGEQERAPLEALLTSCGYSFMEGEFKKVEFTLGSLKGSRGEQQIKKTKSSQAIKKMVTFGELPQDKQQGLLEKVRILWEERFMLSPTRSYVSVHNGQVTGAALISENEGVLDIIQVYSTPENEIASMNCLFATMGEAYETMPYSTIVRFHAVEDIAENLTSKLLDGCDVHTTRERIAYRFVSVAAATAAE